MPQAEKIHLMQGGVPGFYRLWCGRSLSGSSRLGDGHVTDKYNETTCTKCKKKFDAAREKAKAALKSA